MLGYLDNTDYDHRQGFSPFGHLPIAGELEL